MTTPLYNQQIDRKIAWIGSDLNKEKISVDLGPRQLAALDEVFQRLAAKPMTEITRADTGHPDLDQFCADVLSEVQNGRGLVLVRGFPVDRYSMDDIQKLNWIISTQFGDLVPQNALGERLRLIQNEPRKTGEQSASGTKSKDDLAMHTDNAEVFVLTCVRQAMSGGETQFTNAMAIHNEMLKTRPDLLEILYRGFPWHRRGEQRDDQPAITPFNVPVFSNTDGYISVQIAFGSITSAALTMGRPLTALENEALDYLRELTERLQFEMRFAPGEIAVINNLTMFHGRSEYIDYPEPERKRVLLRVWLAAARDRRPVAREIWYMERKNGGPGVDHVPGRTVAANEYYGVPEAVNAAIREAQKRPKAKA